MLKKIFLLLFIIPFQFLFSQSYNKGIYFEVNVAPQDSGGICFLSYRISYRNLVFIKQDNQFNATFSIIFEASDSVGSKYKRDIIERTISAPNYEQTDDEHSFCQGLLSIPLASGNYKILPILNDYNASKEYRWLPINIKVGKAENSIILSPIVVQKKSNSCNEGSDFQLANYESDLIFSKQNYDLLIPVQDLKTENIELQFENNDSTYSKIKPDSSFTGSISFITCEDKIFLKKFDVQNKIKFFRFSSVNTNLVEGKIKINIFTDNKLIKSFDKYVIWENKPRSLSNPELAVKVLSYLADKLELSTLNKTPENKFTNSLLNFWKKYDPSPGTSFNELMNEFYERVDYSIENFSIIGSFNGAETDRGEIYILYGKPDQIKRNYSGNNQTKEIWIYNKPENTFVFTDKSGLGDFTLEKTL